MRGLKAPIGSQATPRIDLSGCVLYAPFWRPDMVAKGGLIVNGTGICTGSPLYLAVGANTVDVTQAGNFTVTMPEGGTVASGTMTVTGSPVTISAGVATTVTTTGATGNITCTVDNIIRSKDTNNHALTITGATWGAQGRNFDGSDDKITIAHNAIFNVTNFTILAWVKDDQVTQGNRKIIGKRELDGSTATFQFGALNATQWDLNWTSGDISKDGIWACDTSDGAYHHVAVSKADGAAPVMYLDNVSLGSNGNTDNPDTITESLTIGCSRWSNDFQGFWDGIEGEIFLYNRVLSIGGIQRHYQATKWRYV